jgi:YD repeat-containing protein
LNISVSNLAIQAAPLLQQSYTPDGLIASLTDANGNTTSFTPDGFDRLATTSYPDGSTENLTYDSDSNVLTRQTRAGPTIAFTYDTLNRLSAKAPPSEPTVSYAYDLARVKVTVRLILPKYAYNLCTVTVMQFRNAVLNLRAWASKQWQFLG